MRPHYSNIKAFSSTKLIGFGPFILLFLLLLSCKEELKYEGDLSFYLNDDADLVVRTFDPKDITSELENNSFLSGLNTSAKFPGLAAQFRKFDTIQPSGETWMAWSVQSDSVVGLTMICRFTDLIQTDSLILDSPLAFIATSKDSIKPITVGNDSIYALAEGEVIIAATSAELLLKSLAGPKIEDVQFNRLSASLSPQRAAVFLKNGMGSSNGLGSSWKGISLDLQPDTFGYNGISQITDSTSVWAADTYGLPMLLRATEIAPATSQLLIERTYKHTDTLLDAAEIGLPQMLLDQSSSYAYLETPLGKALLLKAIDTISFLETITPYSEAVESYKDAARFKLQEPVSFNEVTDSWLATDSLSSYFRLKEFYVFTTTEEMALDIISSFRNNSTLANRSDHKAIDSRLSDGAHLRISGTPKRLLPYLASENSGVLGQEAAINNTQAHELMSLQFTKENGLLYLQGQTVLGQNDAPTTGIRELRNVSLNTTPMGQVKWFSNHRTKGKDIVYQDVENKLHLLAYNGRSLWVKDLGEPILGEVQEVDLLRNGKKQLAFATATRLYVLDRNGKDVAPFPIKFKDEVTQALAVFDYDNNRKYRFVIIQGRDILMYDSNARIVKGFTFTKAPADLAMPPQHLRIGNKDFLCFPLSDGKLLIKSRVGKDRINVNKQFEFGNSPIFQEQGSFVFISGDKTKISIDTRGRVTEKDLGVAQGFSLVIEGNTKVSLDENLLRINGRLYELPYGVYSAPRIDQVGRTRYVSLTDLQEKKVYVFNTSGELLPNFPVYGSGAANIGDANRNRKPNLLTLSDEQTLTIYEY